MKTELPNQPPAAELNIGVEAVQGGVKVIFAYPHLMTAVIIPEANLSQVIASIEEMRKKIPLVIVPGGKH